MPNRDIIVIGASAGGIEALSKLLAQLPATLPATLVIVQHTSESSPGILHQVIGRNCTLPVKMAQDGETIQQGHVYVAPPKHHLLIKEDYLHLTRGPRENRARPAIDPLFRSAAVAYGPRVIGVILTGLLDDGSAGLVAIQRYGGLVVIQDPADALYPDMPRSALEYVTADYCLPLAEITDVLTHLVYQSAGKGGPVSKNLQVEVNMTEAAPHDVQRRQPLGELVEISCPECGGPLRQMQDDPVDRYRCHIGHSFTARALLAEQGEAIERALWAAIRAMKERANLYLTMARRARQGQNERLVHNYEQDAAQTRAHAELLSKLLTGA